MRASLALVAGLALAACGSSGSVTLDLTDAPPDTTVMSKVIVTLSKVEVHVVDKSENKDGDPADKSIDKDDKWQTLALAEDKREFDLLALQNDVTATLGSLELPEGKITQIRLFIDTAGKNQVELKNGDVCKMDLTAVEQGGVKINHPFKALGIEEDKDTRVVVDFDVKESVAQEGACSYKLKPVIKLKTELSGTREKAK